MKDDDERPAVTKREAKPVASLFALLGGDDNDEEESLLLRGAVRPTAAAAAADEDTGERAKDLFAVLSTAFGSRAPDRPEGSAVQDDPWRESDLSLAIARAWSRG